MFKTHDPTAMLPIGRRRARKRKPTRPAKLAFTEARAAILLFKEDATDAEKP